MTKVNDHGPFETDREARDSGAASAVYEAFDRDPGPRKMTPHNHKMLEAACTAAGVELGLHDHRILAWLAGYEPETCAVLAGIITRASQAGAR